MADLAVYGGLFAAALLAATIIPAQSEALLAGLVLSGKYNVALLLAVASLGNVLGSCINWLLGRGIERFRHQRWFPASPEALAKAQGLYSRWGYWSLLLSWVPIIGDPITVIAGILREPFWRFLLIVAIAKIGRYLAIVLLLQ